MVFPPPSCCLLRCVVLADINISIDDNILRIEAQRKEEKRAENEQMHFTERRWGRTSRSVRLPQHVGVEGWRSR